MKLIYNSKNKININNKLNKKKNKNYTRENYTILMKKINKK